MMEYVHHTSGCHSDEMTLVSGSVSKLLPHQVRVTVSAFGINRADTLQRQGKYPAPRGESNILGLEVCGLVTECGDSAQRWQPGDRVFGLVAGGGYATQVNVDENHLMPVPKNVSDEEAAGVAEVFLTAFQALFSLGHLTCGQKILLHAGASGVGLAAIQLAVLSGAQVAVTASTDEKLALCEKMGAALLIHYPTQVFSEQIKTQWGGVDLVLDFVGGGYLNSNLSCLNMDGNIVYLAMLAGRYSQLDMARLLAKRASIQGSTLRNRSDEYKQQLIEEFSRHWLSQLAQGKLKANIQQVLPARQVGQTHQILENNQSMGKFIGVWS